MTFETDIDEDPAVAVGDNAGRIEGGAGIVAPSPAAAENASSRANSFSFGQPSPAQGASDAVPKSAAPDVLAFDSEPIPQVPVPLEIPLAGLGVLGLLTKYFWPRPSGRQLG